MGDAGHEIVALTRRPAGEALGLPEGVRAVQWDAASARGPWAAEVRGADAVINLAGASIGGRPWTARYKRAILESRLNATNALVEAMAGMEPAQRPKVLANASGIDYYGHRQDEIVTEDTPPGDSFLARVCVDWEAAARRAEALGVRVVLMRTSLVIHRDAPAFRLLVLPFRLFAGGPLGSGRQWFTWIHLDDIIGLYRLAVERSDLAGPVNAVAPDVRPQREVAREIGRALGRPSWLPAPAFALRLVLWEQADLLLHGRRAAPRKALAAGYEFRYPKLEQALAHELRA